MPRGSPLRDDATPGKPARGFDTRAVHHRKPPLQAGDPLAAPLDMSSTYSFSDAQAFADASHEKVGAGYVYARWANPTIDMFEATVADLEGSEGAEAFASGMAAISAVFLGLCSSGDRVVAARQLYGNSHSLLTSRLPRYGITADLFDVDDFESIERALPGAKLLYCETIGNPRIQVADLPTLAGLAEAARVPLVVDSTFASPALCRPIEWGADIVMHSATKYLGGHHDLLGGLLCTSEKWLGPIRSIARDLGPTMSPFNAWLALRGVATLPLRVERSSNSALRVAEALKRNPAVERVDYPALDSSPSKPLCDKLLGGRGGGTLGFEVAGGRDRARTFQDSLQTIRPAASLGGSHSLVVNSASVTHTQLDPDQLSDAGISEGFCRLSVGLEDPADLIDDLEQALQSA